MPSIADRIEKIKAYFLDENGRNNLVNPLRGNAYVELAYLYLEIGSPEAKQSAYQLLGQAQITTYSGQLGGAALMGNATAKLKAGSAYNITLDYFSYLIAKRLVAAVERDLDNGGDGVLSVQEMHALDYSVWRELGMGHLFPGNYQRYLDSLSGFTIPSSSVVFDSATYDSTRIDPNFQFSPDMVGLLPAKWSDI